jgi:DNA-binding transcriptional LysR family regulator
MSLKTDTTILAIQEVGRSQRRAQLPFTAIVAPPGTRARQLVDEVRERGVPLRIGVEAAHREAVLPLVLQGAGVAVVTAAWADLARGAGALVLDLEPPQYLHIWLLSRRAPLTPGARAFLDCVLR